MRHRRSHGGEQLTYYGERPDPDRFIALFSNKSDVELEEFTGAGTELERCGKLGARGVLAADSLLKTFRARSGWVLADALTLMVKVFILQRLGLTDQIAQASNALLALDQAASIPGIGQAIAALRDEADRA